MPRTTKIEELNKWIGSTPAHMFRIEFKSSEYNKTIVFLSKSVEDSDIACKKLYPAAISITHLGTIDKVIAGL